MSARVTNRTLGFMVLAALTAAFAAGPAGAGSPEAREVTYVAANPGLYVYAGTYDFTLETDDGRLAPLGYFGTAVDGRRLVLTIDDAGAADGERVPVEITTSSGGSPIRQRCVPVGKRTAIDLGRSFRRVHVRIGPWTHEQLDPCSGIATTGTVRLG